MATDPADRHKRAAQNYLRYIGNTFIFDASAGVHKPKATETPEERQRKNAGTNPESRFFTNPRTDWWPILVASLISIGTLTLLIFTVHYARLQWIEMQKTACAAQSSLDETRKQFRLDQRAWIGVKEFHCLECSNDGKLNIGDFGMTLINTGKTPANNVEIDVTYVRRKRSDHIPAYEDTTKDREQFAKEFGFLHLPKMSPQTYKNMFDNQKLVLAPSGTHGMSVMKGFHWTTNSASVTNETLDDEIVIYVVGRITYNDILSMAIHNSRFCMVNDGGNDFHYCKSGNSMD